MIWAAVLMALAIGFVAGHGSASFLMRHVGEENEQLRGCLRYIRKWVCFSPEHGHVLDAIDAMLSDEAGA